MSRFDNQTDHPFPCEECDGYGGWLHEYAASIVAIEPSHHEIECDACEGRGYQEEVECSECGAPLHEDHPKGGTERRWGWKKGTIEVRFLGFHLCGTTVICAKCAEDPGNHHSPSCEALRGEGETRVGA